ncbi:MAG: peptidyl-prolyl cis-trans isomerase [Verrucomicrobiales bacterium]|nr:peptidyl-prolyl cis-trans isomerase [Verrucomicrobiales bacterium]
MQRVRVSIAVGFASTALALAQGQLVNGLRAVVSDSVITDYQVRASAAPAIDLLRARLGARSDEFQKQAARTLTDALEQLVERQLILHEFNTRGYTLPEKVIDDVVEARIRERYGDRATFARTLRAEGMTLERMRRQVREQIIVNALVEKNVSSQLIVSPYKIEAYYREHQEQFKVPERVRLRLIVLDKTSAATFEERKALGCEILAKLKGGASFTELASIYSTGPHRARGGEWGWATRTELFKGLSDIAFTLEPGKPGPLIGYSGQPTDYQICLYDEHGQPTLVRRFVTDPETKKESMVEERACEGTAAETNSLPGEVFYIVLVEEKAPAHVRPLNEVRDEIEKTLLAQAQDALRKKWIEKLRAKTFVRYF